MRRTSVIAIILLILLGFFAVSRVTDPEEILPVLPQWDVEAVSDPPIGNLTWPPGDPVLGVRIGSESRAYLLSLLEWHGVLNDRMAGRDIAVTYSALSNSGAVYDRSVDDRVLSFEVHDGVYRNSLVLRDKETGSLWSQMDGRALMGPLQGGKLTKIDSTRTIWSEWETLNPTTRVLLPPGDRDYGIHMFGDYKTNDAILFPYRYEDSSLGAKDMVLGIDIERHSVAFPISRLSVERIVMHELGSVRVLVTYAYGAAFAFDAGNSSFSFLFGSTMEDGSGDRWNMTTGRRESDGLTLKSLHTNATICYWFAWLNFNPDTSLYGIESRAFSERSWAVAATPWTVGLLLCLLVFLVNRRLAGRTRDPTRPLRWVVFNRSILISIAAMLASGILLTDSPRNLVMGTVAQQALFGVLFLAFGLATAYEWYHLRDYEGARVPIDMGEFEGNLVRLLGAEEIQTEALVTNKLAWMDVEGGLCLSEPDAEMLFHEGWLFLGRPGGLADRVAPLLRRIAQAAITAPPEDELA